MSRKQAKTELQVRIKALREAVALSQEQFAQAVGVVRPVITRAESGKAQSDGLLVKLGNLAARKKLYSEAVWFWSAAGVEVTGLMPAAVEMLEFTGMSVPRGPVTRVKPSKITVMADAPNTEILLDTRILANPYFTKYIATPREFFVIDEQQTDLWKLIDSRVAARHHPSDLAHIEAATSEVTDAELEQFPMLGPQGAPNQSTGIYVGWLRAKKHGDTTVVTLESPTEFGTMATHVVGVEFGGGERLRRRVRVPYFTLLGSIVAWVDMRGKSLPAGKSTPESKTQKRGKHK